MIDYQSYKWQKKSKHILKLDRGQDRVAALFGKNLEATIVHHIYPAKEYPEYAWSDWNLISVSVRTHNKLENRKTGELSELGLWLKSITKPEENWRKQNENKHTTK